MRATKVSNCLAEAAGTTSYRSDGRGRTNALWSRRAKNSQEPTAQARSNDWQPPRLRLRRSRGPKLQLHPIVVRQSSGRPLDVLWLFPLKKRKEGRVTVRRQQRSSIRGSSEVRVREKETGKGARSGLAFGRAQAKIRHFYCTLDESSKLQQGERRVGAEHLLDARFSSRKFFTCKKLRICKSINEIFLQKQYFL